MAKYGNPNPAGDDMYSDADPAMATETKPKPKESGLPTIRVPKPMFAGQKLNVGDEFLFRVTDIGDDDVGVVYATGGGDKRSYAHDDMAEMMG